MRAIPNWPVTERAIRYWRGEVFAATRIRIRLHSLRGPRLPKRLESEPGFEHLRLWRSPRQYGRRFQHE